MNKEAQTKVARNSRSRAELYLKKGKPGRAFSHFLVALQLNPGWKAELKHLFASTLCTWGRILESKGRYNDLFTCYEQAVDTFGDNEEVLNNLGAHLFRMGHLNEACNFFHQALDVNHSFLPAHRNLESVSNLLVERWHFRMLNDALRNGAYREAIIKKVRQGFNTVLDIGTGTGILSLFAVEGGAKRVYACDYSQAMINVASEVMEANNANTNVILFNKMSNDLTIPRDIPHRVSLVVTETLDAGLLGEHILQTLIHAWDSLLLPSHAHAGTDSQGLVLPFGATIWVAAIECSYIARRCRLLPQDNESIQHREYGVNNENNECLEFLKVNLIALEDEPYDTQDLNRIPEGFRFLTPATQAMHINFNDRHEMAKYLSRKHEGHQFSVKCTTSGHIDAMAAWFELQLDEDLTLSSSPEENEHKASCWDQTVFPLQDQLYVTPNQELQVKITCNGGKLSLKVNSSKTNGQDNVERFEHKPSTSEDGPMEGEHHMQCSSENNRTFTPKNDSMENEDEGAHGITSGSIENLANLVLEKLGTDCLQSSGDSRSDKHRLPVSQDIITFLNDEQWMKALNEAANLLLQVTDSDTQDWNILDLSPFPVLGITLLKSLTKAHDNSTKWDQLTCVVKDNKDEVAIRYIAEANGIDNAHIECIKEELLEDNLDSKSHFDLIMVHLVNSRGELKELYINYLPMLKKLLKKNGLLLPRQLSMYCELIHSDWLAEVSRALGEDRVCGYKVAEFINTYQVSEHLDFCLQSLDNTSCSDIIEVLNIWCGSLTSTVESPLMVKMKVPIKNTGYVNAIPYWFKLQIFGASREVSTMHVGSYANQTAVLIYPEVLVTAGESIELILTCHQGLIHAGLEEDEE